MLQELLDAYGIIRKEKAYGKLLRICVQNKVQLQKITSIIELILVTEEINVEEIAFPEWPVDRKFMLFIKGSPHDAIESIFVQTDIKWKITAVEYEFPEIEIHRVNMSISENGTNGENGGNGGNGGNDGNGRNGENGDGGDFLESQYAILVTNTMREKRISRKEAENRIQIWFHWRTKDGKNNVRFDQPGKENNTLSEVRKYLEEADKLFTSSSDPQSSSNNGSSHSRPRNQNQNNCCYNIFNSFYIFLIFCCKNFILLSLAILAYILYTNDQYSLNLKNNMQKTFP
jgi:hypothetical protein